MSASYAVNSADSVTIFIYTFSSNPTPVFSVGFRYVIQESLK